MAPTRFHLHDCAAVVAMLPLVAILFPVASAASTSSLAGAGLSPTASASSSPIVARLSSASSSPPVTGVSTVVCASSSPLATALSTVACASSPLVTGLFSTAACVSSSPSRLSPTACAPSSSCYRGGSDVALSVGDTCLISFCAIAAPSSTTSTSGPDAAANATVRSTTTTADDEAQRAPSESVDIIWYGCAAFASPPPAQEPAPATTSATISLRAATTTTPISTSSSSSPGRMLLLISIVAAILAAAGGWAIGASDGQQQQSGNDDWCQVCFIEKKVFLLKCCRKTVCNLCLRDFVRDAHKGSCKGLATGRIVPLLHPRELKIGNVVPEDYAHLPEYPPWYFVKSVKKNYRIHLFYYNLQELESGAEPRAMEVIHLADPDGVSAAIRTDIYPTMRSFSEL